MPIAGVDAFIFIRTCSGRRHTSPSRRRRSLSVANAFATDDDGAGPSVQLTTALARARRVWGTSKSSFRAVFRLMIILYEVGCRMGKSAGLVPLRIIAAYTPTR